MSNTADSDQILHYLGTHGPTRSSDLLSQLNLSRSTLSRHVRESAGALVVIGKGRATRLGVRLPDLEAPIPLYRISESRAMDRSSGRSRPRGIRMEPSRPLSLPNATEKLAPSHRRKR